VPDISVGHVNAQESNWNATLVDKEAFILLRANSQLNFRLPSVPRWRRCSSIPEEPAQSEFWRSMYWSRLFAHQPEWKNFAGSTIL